MATRWTRRSKWLALGFGVCALLLGALAVWKAKGDAGGLQSLQSRTPIAAGPDWSVGEARTFSTTFKSKVHAGPDAVVDVAVSGTWTLTRLSVEPGAARLGAELDPTSVKLITSPESEASVSRAIRERTVIQISERGLVNGIGFAKGERPGAEHALARGVLRTLAASLQVARSPAPSAATWTAQELDFTGTYEASYERIGPEKLRKRKREYQACRSCGASGARTTTLSSLVEIGIGAGAASPLGLDRVDLSERTRVDGGEPMPQLSSETQIALRLSAVRRIKDSALAALTSELQDVRLMVLDDRKLDHRAVLGQAKLGKTTFSGLADEIARLDAAGQRSAGPRARAYSQLVAHMRYDAESVDKALSRIRAGDPLRDTLVDALGNAGTEPAQAALRALFKEQEGDDRHEIVLALSLTPQPSNATTEFLSGLQDDPTLGRQSRYGLGTAAYHLKESDSARSEAIVAGLARRLAQASDLPSMIEYLNALGNAATPSALAPIQPYLAHENASVRAAAVDALRRIPGEATDQYLASALKSDPSPNVRLKAVSAFAYRSASSVLVYALREVLSKESDRSVRLEAARAALKWASEAPLLRAALAKVAADDPDAKIRKVAASAG